MFDCHIFITYVKKPEDFIQISNNQKYMRIKSSKKKKSKF